VIAILVVAVLALALAGCGSTTTTTTAAVTTTTAAATTTTAAPATITTAAPATTTTAASAETVFQKAEKASFASLGDVPKPSKPYKIGHLLITLQNPFWVTVGEGSKAAAAKYGMTVNVQAAPTEGDVTSQLNTLETMVGQDYNAIICHTITAQNLVPGIVKGYQKGILMIDGHGAIDAKAVAADGAKMPQFNIVDYKKQGAMGATFIVEKLGSDKGKVAIIEGIAGAPQSDARAAGAKEAFEAAGFQVVSSQPGNWDRTVALNVATNVLQANPDLKGFYCANDVMALAASEAVAAAGKQGKVLIVGTDLIDDAKTAIKDGRLDASVAFSPYIVGELVLAATIKLLEGGTVPSDLSVANIVVSKANVEQMADWK
jgi:D-allose transport system substrate-binding protein